MSHADELARLKELYLPPSTHPVLVDVPEFRYVVIDGHDATDRAALEYATKWLFAAVLPTKQIARKRMGKDFVEAPLEGLWWADDPADLVHANRERLRWRLMIVTPDWMTEAMLDEGVRAAGARLGERPESLRFEALHEGLSAQIMHIGPNAQEPATIARLHDEFLPASGLVAHGKHHEIYLNDPKRVAPERLKTVIRQPVRRA
ncbi:MAG: GyrI-like domain-containing protein [Phycisphaeraceae bacterium]|nr:GyrI-like domain-containing protein [Phycisphaeraceae bacterium]